MKSKYKKKELEKFIKKLKTKGVKRNLAERIYTSRLLGNDSEIVLHGGGNTSLKAEIKLQNKMEKILFVKGSGIDMKYIDEKGFPALELTNLLKLKDLKKINDFEMINFQKKYMVNTNFPSPSVETLLHAFLPHKFVDHSHSNAILSLINQSNPIKICKRVFANKLAIVPYIMPGYELAKLSHSIYSKYPNCEGLILLNHGIFTFGNTAKQSYERMIKFINLAEKELKKNSKKFKIIKYKEKKISSNDLSILIRKNINDCKDGILHKKILLFNNPIFLDELFSHPNLNNFNNIGPVTPDHVIRIKSFPLILDFSKVSKNKIESLLIKKINIFKENYIKYFNKYKHINKNANMFDPNPKIILVKGLGMFSVGTTYKDTKIAMDIGTTALKVFLDSIKYGRFKTIPPKEVFKMEYWPLELAKLKENNKNLRGHVTVITGGVGVLGYATAKKFLNEGSEIVLIDIKNEKDIKLNMQGMSYFKCDITNFDQIKSTFDKIIAKYGGIDILISNAGLAIHSSLAKLSKKDLDKSFDVNLFGHHNFVKYGVNILKNQDIGGTVLFNISKQAVNPAPNFGAYGMSKATLLYLMKQYAVEFGSFGIRFNGINADRIKTGLLDDRMIKLRAKSRGISKQNYMKGNLLNIEVEPDDVADAFYFLAMSKKTTACVLTIDGGKIEASLR